jgi:hypothetical protein
MESGYGLEPGWLPPGAPWLTQPPTGPAGALYNPASLSLAPGVAMPAVMWQHPWVFPQSEGHYVSWGGTGENAAPPPPPPPPPLVPPGTLPWWTTGTESTSAPPLPPHMVPWGNQTCLPSPAFPLRQWEWYWAPPETSAPNGNYDWDDEERRAVSITLLGLRDGAPVSADLAWAAAALLPRNAHCASRMQRRQSRRRLREARRLYRHETPLFGVPYGLPGIHWHLKSVDASEETPGSTGAAMKAEEEESGTEVQELRALWREEAHRHSMPGRGYLTVFRILGGQGKVMRLFEDVPEWATADQSQDSRHLDELEDPDEHEPEPAIPVPAKQKSTINRRRAGAPGSAATNGPHAETLPPPSGAIRGRGGNLERLLAPGTDVAFRVKDDDGEWNWILGTVSCYLSEERKYRVADRGEEMVEAFERRGDECSPPANRLDSGKYRLYQVARSRVRPLPSRAAENLRLRPSMKVLALYPGTSALYPATVLESAETVMREPGNPHGMAYKLVFENEDDVEEDSSDDERVDSKEDIPGEAGPVPFKYVHARFVLPLL